MHLTADHKSVGLGQATGLDGSDNKQNATLDRGVTLNQTFVFREDWGNHLYGKHFFTLPMIM